MAFDRITVEPDKLKGSPVSAGCASPLRPWSALVAAGWTSEQILEEYPDLERADSNGRSSTRSRDRRARASAPLPRVKLLVDENLPPRLAVLVSMSWSAARDAPSALCTASAAPRG
jgi:hypothetical protein